MAQRKFQQLDDARKFAREIAINTKTTTKLIYQDGFWIVEGKTVVSVIEQILLPASGTTINDAMLIIGGIRKKLTEEDNFEEIINILDSGYKKIIDIVETDESNFSTDDLILIKKIPRLLTELSSASDAMEDLPYVKSKEYATELAYKFQELSESLAEYGVSRCLRRHMLAMLDASKTMQSESTAITDGALRQALSLLQSTADSCKCGRGRMVIRESSYGFFWGCNSFPTCFYKRGLTKVQMDMLTL